MEFHLNMDARTHKYEHWLIHTESEIRQQFVLVSNFFFFAIFFYEFDKQNKLVAINVNDNFTTQALSQQQHARITT